MDERRSCKEIEFLYEIIAFLWIIWMKTESDRGKDKWIETLIDERLEENKNTSKNISVDLYIK